MVVTNVTCSDTALQDDISMKFTLTPKGNMIDPEGTLHTIYPKRSNR